MHNLSPIAIFDKPIERGGILDGEVAVEQTPYRIVLLGKEIGHRNALSAGKTHLLMLIFDPSATDYATWRKDQRQDILDNTPYIAKYRHRKL